MQVFESTFFKNFLRRRGHPSLSHPFNNLSSVALSKPLIYATTSYSFMQKVNGYFVNFIIFIILALFFFLLHCHQKIDITKGFTSKLRKVKFQSQVTELMQEFFFGYFILCSASFSAFTNFQANRAEDLEIVSLF